MPYLPNFLDLFTPECGLSPEAIERALRRTLDNPDGRELDGLKRELTAIYEDARTDWISLLQNEQMGIPGPESQHEAREFVTKRLWNVLFPDEADRPPGASQ